VRVISLLLSLWLVAGGIDPAAHRAEIEGWQKTRDMRLRADGGWLTVAGLFWLKPGVNRFGTAATNDIVLPPGSTAASAGVFAVDGARVTVELAPAVGATLVGKPVTKTPLRSDAGGAEPDVLALGALTMQVIERDGRLAIRLKDLHSKLRRDFKGLRYYPTQLSYRVVARFVPHAKPASLALPNMLGFSETVPSPGYAEFQIAGKTFRLDPVIETPGDTVLFFVFRDQTAGKTTYGAGRFLYADAPKDGRIVLDFNKAYTPPCGFTPYATCPLPPPQNKLRVAIEAGELYDGVH
jgi:uncharacterized protein (DUF1684 family)